MEFNPPNNIEAEKAYLSYIFIDQNYLYQALDYWLNPDDFYLPKHQIIFESILNLWHDKKNIDIALLAEELKKQGKLEDAWWVDYLWELVNYFLPWWNPLEYVKIIKQKSILRNALKAAQNVIYSIYEEKEYEEILQHVENILLSFTSRISDNIKDIWKVSEERFNFYSSLLYDNSEYKNNIISTWYKKLDEIIWWFRPWSFIVLAARPSMWKTALALNFALNAPYDKPIVIFSLEMSIEQLVDRLFTILSWYSIDDFLKFWKVEEKEEISFDEALSIAFEKLQKYNIYFIWSQVNSIYDVRSILKRLKIEKKQLWLVIIDYLQLLSWWNKYKWNRVQEISEISRTLKLLAVELEVPILALSQLSRDIEKRQDKRPQLSDLRESWAIEQDADIVMMIHREDFYDPETDRKNIIDLYIRKNRSWQIWEIQLYHEKKLYKFYEYEEKKKRTLSKKEDDDYF